MTEITKTNERTQSGEWVLYDGDCSICVGLRNRYAGVLARHGFAMAALQVSWVRNRVGLREGEVPSEMGVITREGDYLGGPDALRHILDRIWWASPLAELSRLALIRHGFDFAYRSIARRRRCISGNCLVNRGDAGNRQILASAWLPGIALTITGIACWGVLQAWAQMWFLAFCVYGFCKVLVLQSVEDEGRHWPAGHWAAFVIAWPGMDPGPFLRRVDSVQHARVAEWIVAVGKTALGAILFWCVARMAWPEVPLLAGWLGMVGAILLLHFGCFHLLALFWRSRGVQVMPIMNAPMLATSITEFWGKRWNRAFRWLAHNFIYLPGARRLGRRRAALIVFAVSGLVHELIISLPAKGGFGGPSLFFLIQYAGLHLQRLPLSRRWGLDRGAPGWVYTMLFVVGPLPLLFHAPFVEQVFLPFMQVSHAIHGGVL